MKFYITLLNKNSLYLYNSTFYVFDFLDQRTIRRNYHEVHDYSETGTSRGDGTNALISVKLTGNISFSVISSWADNSKTIKQFRKPIYEII